MDEYGLTPLDVADNEKHREVFQLIGKMIGYSQSELDSDWYNSQLHDLTKEAQFILTDFLEMLKRKSVRKSVHQNLFNSYWYEYQQNEDQQFLTDFIEAIKIISTGKSMYTKIYLSVNSCK